MIRHIIVEGPDGSGKDGLIKRLLTHLPEHRVHERASTSTGGPVPFLNQWVARDMRSIGIDGPWIYNRHPIISEPIYAPIARQTKPQPPFDDAGWVAITLKALAENCLIVWCMPAWSIVRRNVLSGDVPHMPGVVANIRELYAAYRVAPGTWPGVSLYWDYSLTSIEDLMFDIRTIFAGEKS